VRLPRTPRLIALGIVPLVVAGALVAPSAVAEPRKSIDEVQAELDALETKAEMAQEQYNGAQAKLDKIRKLEDAARAKVKSARTRLAAQQEAIGEIVSSAYRAGGIDVSVQLLMADDPQDFLRQATAVDQLAANQSAALRKTQSARLALAQATATLAQQEQAAEALVKEMADRKAEVDAAVAETLTVLENLRRRSASASPRSPRRRRPADKLLPTRAPARLPRPTAPAIRGPRPTTAPATTPTRTPGPPAGAATAAAGPPASVRPSPSTTRWPRSASPTPTARARRAAGTARS
jgi:hypothetical protein